MFLNVQISTEKCAPIINALIHCALFCGKTVLIHWNQCWDISLSRLWLGIHMKLKVSENKTNEWNTWIEAIALVNLCSPRLACDNINLISYRSWNSNVHPEKRCLNNERGVQEDPDNISRLKHSEHSSCSMWSTTAHFLLESEVWILLVLGVNNHPNIVDTQVKGYCGELLCLLFGLRTNFSEEAGWNVKELLLSRPRWPGFGVIGSQAGLNLWTPGTTLRDWLLTSSVCFVCFPGAPHAIQYWPTVWKDLQELT